MKQRNLIAVAIGMALVAFSAYLSDAQALCNPTAAAVTQNANQLMGAESCDLSGNQRDTLGTLLAGENQGSAQSSSWMAVRPLVHATYSASNTWTPPATPTDLLTITGSASKTIRVLSIKVTTTNTAAGSQQFFVIKRSTADGTGTPVAGTAIPWDSGNAAASATINHYTANPGSLGTAVGTINTVRVSSPVAVPGAFTTNVDAGKEMLPTIKSGGVPTAQPVILRGIAEQLVINFNGAALVAGQTHAYVIVWTESVSPSE